MALNKDFSDSKLNPEEEEKYLNTIFDKHYDKKLKSKYSAVLKDTHGVQREESNVVDIKREGSNVRTIVKFVLSVAAGALLAFFALGINSDTYMQQTDTYLAESIFVNQELLRGETRTNEIRNEAILAYNEGDMPTALDRYAKIEVKTSEDAFFEGLAFMYDKQYAKAIEVLAAIPTDNFKYKSELDWYLSLCYAKTDQKEKAIEQLSKLNNWKKKEAEQLIKLLSK